MLIKLTRATRYLGALLNFSGGGAGGGGFIYPTSADRPFATVAARNTWAAANTGDLVDGSTVVLVSGSPQTWYLWTGETNPNTVDANLWIDATPLIQGPPGASGATQEGFRSIAQRDTYFAANPEQLRTGAPFLLHDVTLGEDVVLLQVWQGTDQPSAYNPATDAVFFQSATIRADTSSFELGDIHKITSGGENVYFENQDSDVNYFPPWQSVGDHRTPAGRTVQNRPTARTYGPLTPTEFGGPAASTGQTDYNVEFTLPDNESVHGVTVIAMEAYTGSLTYRVTRVRPQGNQVVYNHTEDVVTTVNGNLVLWFEVPLDGRQGTETIVQLVKPDGTFLSVRPVASDADTPYTLVQVRNFTDDGLAYQSELSSEPRKLERRDTSLTIDASNVAQYQPVAAIEFTNETGQVDLVLGDDVFTIGDELQIKHFSRGGIAGAQVRVDQQGTNARIDAESDVVVIQDAAMIMRYVAENTWRIFASHDFNETRSGNLGQASLHSLSTSLPDSVNVGTALPTSVTVEYNVTNHADIRTLQLQIDGQSFTPPLPTQDGPQSYTATVTAISTTAPRNIITSLTGFRRNGSALNTVTDSTAVVVPPPSVFWGRSASNNPATVDTATLQSAPRANRMTVGTGQAAAGDYFIVLAPDSQAISKITDTVLDQDVLSLFTKTEDVRQIAGLEYDAYVIGPLVAGVNENYILEF
ncbi:hypothetical protein [Vibrio phage VP16T]|nr:hypothetical protein [Vibrio phage VP16T]